MSVTQNTKISIGVIIAVIPLIAGAVAWYDGRKQDEHKALEHHFIAGDIELDLQRVELEMKLLRTIQERRELTEDEKDRLEYLKQLREVLVAEQRKKVA